MKITIKYDSSWRQSFLDGSNNEPLNKKGRKYIASIKCLKNEDNFIKRDVTKDTVMGVLNRLIGDQRKLHQARADSKYYFADIDRDVGGKVGFYDNSQITDEMIYLRNVSGSTGEKAHTGAIFSNDPMFLSDYSKEFWSVLFLEFDDLVRFVLKNKCNADVSFALDPISVVSRLEDIQKQKPVPCSDEIKDVMREFVSHFGDTDYQNKNGDAVVISLYCSALYLQLHRLEKKYDMETAKTKSGGISGISKRGFTRKDVMNRFTTGEKKKIWGNPYIRETKEKGVGSTKHLMRKASGKLDILLDIPRDRAKEIKNLIENAGVSSFYIGKKGLAYVEKISTKEMDT